MLVITVALGTLLAVLYERRFFGRNAAVLLVIAPFFVMPTVSALVWKNMILHPVYGLLALAFGKLGLAPIDWFGAYPMLSLVIILSWEWLPFAFLILFTSLKSLDAEQKEAAQIDGANAVQFFFHITIPHLRRAMSVVVMIETIFLLSIFAEIYTTTSGGPGTATTNLAYLVYSLGLQQFDVGIASAGRNSGGRSGQYRGLFPGAHFGREPERRALTWKGRRYEAATVIDRRYKSEPGSWACSAGWWPWCCFSRSFG